MVGVDHVYIVEVGRGSLVGDVDRMLQRKIPHRESLKLGIASLDTALVLIVKLAQTHGHLAAAGAGRRHNHQRTRSLHIVVAPEAAV